MIINTLKTLGKNLKREVRAYRLVLGDPRTPTLPKILLGLAIGYLVLPFDFIPDFLSLIGHLDDLILIPGFVFLALELIPACVVEDCRRTMKEERDES
jgi:uncharacterized membrane protein YkvA (DUF1232 family)